MKLKQMSVIIMLLGIVFTGCKTMPDPPVQAANPLPRAPIMKQYKPLALNKVVVRIPRGQKIGGLYLDLNCYEDLSLKWQSMGNHSVDVSMFEDVFREDMQSAGFDMAGDPTDLFAETSLNYNGAEYLVGALVKDIDYHLCRPIFGWNFDSVRGWSRFKVSWQFFSVLEQRVVYETTTEGLFRQDDRTDEIDELDFYRNAFSAATQNLMADSGFQKLVVPNTTVGQPKEQYETPIIIKPNRLTSQSITEHMASTRDATVLIHIGHNSHGSGFFIDKSGYLLTNRHVTGSAKRITVEMSTGRKLVAEVLRTDRARDIALLKVEEGNYPSLPLQLNDPEIGSEVFAIGAPQLKTMKFSVTKGIVSAYRDLKGQPILQSDVNTRGGNSGGPLVDNKGNVVAVCVIGYLNAQGDAFGANGFIPIKSALDALNIKIR